MSENLGGAEDKAMTKEVGLKNEVATLQGDVIKQFSLW